MCLRVIKHERLVIIHTVDRTVKSAEQYRSVVHFSLHRIALDGKGLEGDVESRDSPAEIKRSVDAFRCEFDVNMRQLVSGM